MQKGGKNYKNNLRQKTTRFRNLLQKEKEKNYIEKKEKLKQKKNIKRNTPQKNLSHTHYKTNPRTPQNNDHKHYP